MGCFYKKCKNLAKNEGVLGINEIQSETKKEQGRSMVEMLGVLAIIGVLSIGAISGYRYAMNKYRANQTVNELNLLSHQVAVAMMSKNGLSGTLKLGEPYDTNKKLTSSGYQFEFGCGESGTNADCAGQTKFYMQLSGLPESVCQELAKTRSLLQYSDNDSAVVCTADSDNTLVFAFDAEKPVVLPETGETIFSTAAQDDEAEISTVDSFETESNQIVSGSEPFDDLIESASLVSASVDRCSGHGSWDYSASSCVCDRLYKGADCAIYDENTCSGRGIMMYGRFCFCDAGWGGSDCAENYSQLKCSGMGIWYNDVFGGGSCVCDEGLGGADCTQDYNQFKCLGKGVWHNSLEGSYCVCNAGWGGEDCSKCSGHGDGNYYEGKCICLEGYRGDDCEIEDPNTCSQHGIWSYGACSCNDGWFGEDCSFDRTCSGHGSWTGSYCSCNAGWCGLGCSEDCNQTRCSGHGSWMGSYCSCEAGWLGADCSKCSGHAVANHYDQGKCGCAQGYRGDDCEIEDSDTCSGHGLWYYGQCSCSLEWTGLNCETRK